MTKKYDLPKVPKIPKVSLILMIIFLLGGSLLIMWPNPPFLKIGIDLSGLIVSYLSHIFIVAATFYYIYFESKSIERGENK